MTVPGPSALTLRGVAAAVLTPTELIAAHAGHRVPEPHRPFSGVLTSRRGGYQVRGDVVELDRWEGVTATVAMVELLDLAAAAGTDAAAARLRAALADEGRAGKDAARHIARHGTGGHCLTAQQMQEPAWRAIHARLGAVRVAVAAWWDPTVAPIEPASEQLDLFAAL
jgi:hypothetical protein